jgi:hypothetical protein
MCGCGAMSPFLQHPLALSADQMLQSGGLALGAPPRYIPVATGSDHDVGGLALGAPPRYIPVATGSDHDAGGLAMSAANTCQTGLPWCGRASST